MSAPSSSDDTPIAAAAKYGPDAAARAFNMAELPPFFIQFDQIYFRDWLKLSAADFEPGIWYHHVVDPVELEACESILRSVTRLRGLGLKPTVS